jgi:hypothetical protein
MSNPDEYGVRREPVFLTRPDGRPGRALPAVDLDEAGRAHLRQVHDAVAQLTGPAVEPLTRLEAIAALLVALPYGDMMAFAEGCEASAAKVWDWAKANVREARDGG